MELMASLFSVVAFFLNGYILFRQWPSRKGPSDMGFMKLATLLDPLVTVIVCPMALDLFFTPTWLGGCSATYTAIIACVIVVLYLSSLVVCHRLIESALPQRCGEQPGGLPAWALATVGPLTLVLGCSTSLNLVLTCLLQPLVSKYYALNEKFDDEMCQPFFLTEMMLHIFLICVMLQIFYTGVYFCICRANMREEEIEYCGKTNRQVQRDQALVIIHALTVLLCLVSACVLRFIFMTCSCNGLFEMTRSFPTVVALMTLKLPCAALMQLRTGATK
ncbi:hypothetical protein EGW08_001770 [Elysia chlorotica]|uniref:Uncharacterized protein n=1 Tax=Elysia chlorotica TaxID=188477 RepID=A0A3S1A4M2_ELYCH|nr:hypothetical protein EGW08_001770 [Elysia chlorotica]